MINSINPRGKKRKETNVASMAFACKWSFLLFSGLHKQDKTIVNGLCFVHFNDTFLSLLVGSSGGDSRASKVHGYIALIYLLPHIKNTSHSTDSAFTTTGNSCFQKQTENIKKK